VVLKKQQCGKTSSNSYEHLIDTINTVPNLYDILSSVEQKIRKMSSIMEVNGVQKALNPTDLKKKKQFLLEFCRLSHSGLDDTRVRKL